MRVALSVCVLVGMTGCRSGPQQWGPFRGQVIDDESGKPIAGANVMVLWIREPPSLHFTQSFYDAQEAVTDAEGRFQIPQRRHFLTAWVQAPGLSVFVPGYLMQPPRVAPPDGQRYTDPTVVPMRSLKTLDERCKYEPFGIRGDAQAWVPNFVRAERTYQSSLDCAGLR